MKRPLLVFAHRGEAQSFFENFSYISLHELDSTNSTSGAGHPSKNKIFCFRQCFIILTGSSIKKNQELLSQAITKLGEDISHVILMGFAGSLKENPSAVQNPSTLPNPSTLLIGKTLLVKRVLATDASDAPSQKIKLLKQCFYSDHPEADGELLTHTKVVDEQKTKTQLRLFAELVDLELYWQAKTVESFALPCFFLKVISDYADHTATKESVLKNSPALSQKLFDAAKTIISPAKINRLIASGEKNKNVSNPFGWQNLLRKHIQKKSKILIEQLEKKMNDHLSYSNRAKLQECIINDFRKLYTKQNNFSSVEKEVRKKWNLPTNKNKLCFKTFLSKKMPKTTL